MHTSVFIEIWYFRNHSNILIIISVVLLNVFLCLCENCDAQIVDAQWLFKTDYGACLFKTLRFQTNHFCCHNLFKVNDSDSSSDYSDDDEVIIRGRSEPVETRPILSVRKYCLYYVVPLSILCCAMLAKIKIIRALLVLSSDITERAANIDHFDIVERVEMGQMASMFFNKGKVSFVIIYYSIIFS